MGLTNKLIISCESGCYYLWSRVKPRGTLINVQGLNSAIDKGFCVGMAGGGVDESLERVITESGKALGISILTNGGRSIIC